MNTGFHSKLVKEDSFIPFALYSSDWLVLVALQSGY